MLRQGCRLGFKAVVMSTIGEPSSSASSAQLNLLVMEPVASDLHEQEIPRFPGMTG